MADALAASENLRVFVSYSRDDTDFADQLVEGLALTGIEATVDRHGISGGEAWEARLGALIRAADAVVFVLSPSSARSDVCGWEVDAAAALNKRIIPVIPRALDGAAPPHKLQDLNYIFFYGEPKTPGSGFGSGLKRLTAALNTNLTWLREHTRLLERATEWESAGRASDRSFANEKSMRAIHCPAKKLGNGALQTSSKSPFSIRRDQIDRRHFQRLSQFEQPTTSLLKGMKRPKCIRASIEAVIDAARSRGLLPADTANPARWKGHLANLLPPQQRLSRGHHADGADAAAGRGREPACDGRAARSSSLNSLRRAGAQSNQRTCG